MDSIDGLFDKFAVAYQHSLYAIEQEESKMNAKRLGGRADVKERFERERSKLSTLSENNLMAVLYKFDEICKQMSKSEDTIMRVADYLIYGKIIAIRQKQTISDKLLPCIIPFIGNGNVMLESNGDECHTTGVMFVLEALHQTAPGQLSVAVINPELRSEFSVFTRLKEFQMLTKVGEIRDFFSDITEEMVETDSLLQDRYDSLIELREAAKQPVGRLRLIVIQDFPENEDRNFRNQIIRIMKGAPQKGIVTLVLAGKNISSDNKIVQSIKNLSNFSIFYSKASCIL